MRERDLGAASPCTALSAGDLLCAGLPAHLGWLLCPGRCKHQWGQHGAHRQWCPVSYWSQPNTTLVKPMSLATGMSLCWTRPAGHCFFESLNSQLYAPLFWVPSSFHCTLSKKDCDPSLNEFPVCLELCLPALDLLLPLFKDPFTPVQVRQQHPAAHGHLHGWSLVQHPSVPQQHVAGGMVPVRESCH